MSPDLGLTLEVVSVALLLVYFTGIIIHGGVTIYITAWAAKRVVRKRGGSSPERAFTVLIPCRHESGVIGDTLQSLSKVEYPTNLLEVLVLCNPDDVKTIQAARDVIGRYNLSHVRVELCKAKPGKSASLNHGLRVAKHDYVAVFDAEDDIATGIFTQANEAFRDANVGAVQGGIQLMNSKGRWFNIANILEYFLWYKYRIHYFSHIGAVTLGGNTVVFEKTLLRDIGGWNEKMLTEDADIGIRIAAAGRRVVTVYSQDVNTKEEVPATLRSFIRQRSRWNQGFLQILLDGEVHALKSFRQRFIILYNLSAPFVMMAAGIFAVPMILLGRIYDIPREITYVGFGALVILIIQACITLRALHALSREQSMQLKRSHYVYVVLIIIPYNVVLSFATIRALYRAFNGLVNWEKTAHIGQHRASQSREGGL